MSTTIMPFLYQTRTLSALPWKTASSVGRRCTPTPYHNLNHPIRIARTYATRTHGAVDRDAIPTTSSAPGSSADSSKPLPIRRSPLRTEPPPPGGWEINTDVWSDTYTGDDYTKASNSGKKAGYLPKRRATTRTDDEMIAFEDNYDTNRQAPLDNSIDSFADSYYRKPDKMTITISEKRAFQRIFEDVFQRQQQSAQQSQTSEPPIPSRKPSVEKEKQKKALRMASSILSDAVLGHKPKRVEEAVQQYPPALRAAAARAIGGVPSNEIESEAGLAVKQVEALRDQERQRIETLMTQVKSDVELWEVMNNEVFTLIPKLGLGMPQLEGSSLPGKEKKDKKKEKRKKKRSKNSAPETETQKEPEKKTQFEESPETESDNKLSPLALYGPLYPEFLLLGLRLMDRSFARSSPLALSILPKIKSLGFISHVLGASTQFYNELLRVYRYQYDDFRGMLALLLEMENAALDLDEDTLAIVMDVRKTQSSVLTGQRGPALAALWSLPEFAPGRFAKWHDAITDAMREKAEESSSQVYDI